jgi:hypothetical protein
MAAAAAPFRAWDMAPVTVHLPTGLGTNDCAFDNAAKLKITMTIRKTAVDLRITASGTFFLNALGRMAHQLGARTTKGICLMFFPKPATIWGGRLTSIPVRKKRPIKMGTQVL